MLGDELPLPLFAAAILTQIAMKADGS